MRLTKPVGIMALLSVVIAAWAASAQAASLYDLEALSARKVHYNGDYLLEKAWPAALMFGGLTYQSTDIADSGRNSDGYYVIVRLNYLNLLDLHHWIKFMFTYDSYGNISKIEIHDYSDIIAPSFISSSNLIRALF